jgi:hypothetical protein
MSTDHSQQPLLDESVRCSGCETSRLWMFFDATHADVDAIGTCPDYGTHILGFDTITDEDREELDEFFRTVNWRKYR